ncbi:MAG TPA: DUF3427 domain-containing protein [Vitreimonas sp.]|uniref:GIY-YIG nuclease family protein n=1 Tax=Vitreimonas sp. TaxID=3069702 RepID=UPI002D2E0F4A|nr:DUF3427 domain-containing protein [Vitreimonas sp.]HYD86237.1 DUF3427 domain-containing protein [Vitreimonas sp.]
MALKNLTRESVLQAIVEFDQLGREAFLDRYGFGQSRSYFLVHNGRYYDSKAIAGVAHGFTSPDASPLRSGEFTGGERTVQPVLVALGFQVVMNNDERQAPRWLDRLRLNGLYTRDQVADIIGYPQEKRGGGDFDTGYTKHDDAYFIFANVGNAGRTGHDYANRWDGRDLIWFGKSNTRIDQPRIQEMIGGDFDVYVFWRGKDRSPFTFAGVGRAVEADASTPVRVIWSFGRAAEGRGPDEFQPRQPNFRRGPKPKGGRREFTITDGPCSIYLMVLHGVPETMLANRSSGTCAIKVGMSNDIERREAELNFGFPPSLSLEWRVMACREYGSFDDAFAAETRLLEHLRERELGVGGEFAVVGPEDLEEVRCLLKTPE